MGWNKSDNYKFPSRNVGDSSQLINWILDLGATCNMKPQVLDFLPGSLEDTDKYIEVADVNCVKTEKKGNFK